MVFTNMNEKYMLLVLYVWVNLPLSLARPVICVQRMVYCLLKRKGKKIMMKKKKKKNPQNALMAGKKYGNWMFESNPIHSCRHALIPLDSFLEQLMRAEFAIDQSSSVKRKKRHFTFECKYHLIMNTNKWYCSEWMLVVTSLLCFVKFTESLHDLFV